MDRMRAWPHRRAHDAGTRSPAAWCTARSPVRSRRAASSSVSLAAQMRRPVPAPHAPASPAAPGRGPSASSARTSSMRPACQHRGEARARWRARSAARGGSSRMAANRHGAGAPPAPARRPARVPVPRHTSQARAMRWLSVGRSRAAVAGIRRRRAAHAARPGRARRAGRALPPAPRRRDRGSPPAPRSATRNRARCHRSGSAAARPPAPLPWRPAPRRATRRRCPLPRPAGRRRARCGTRASSSGVGRAVSTRSSRYTCMASALMIVPPQPFGQRQRERRLAAGGRAGDDQQGGSA